ncbi:MAG: hypothetical protein ABI207_02085 [Crocinitomicaceae bacterium]
MQHLSQENPNYKYLFFNKEELKLELKKWSRIDLINWLKWNDPNGIYRDEESLHELGNIMSYEEGIGLVIKQIIQDEI